MTAGDWVALGGLLIAGASLLISFRVRSQCRKLLADVDRKLLDDTAQRERSVRAWVSGIALDDGPSPLRCTLSLKHPLLGGDCELTAVKIETANALRADLSHAGHCRSFTTGFERRLDPPIRVGSEAVQLDLSLHLLKRDQVEALVTFEGLRLNAGRTPFQFSIPLLADRSVSEIPA